MSTTYHLAVDLGATSGRTILASYDGDKVVMEELTRFKYPMIPFNGHLFWNLPLLYQEILNGIKKSNDVLAAKGDGAKLETIGIDSWGCDVAYFYRDGSLAGLPYCYRDSHTEGAVERFCEKMPREKVYEKTGIPSRLIRPNLSRQPTKSSSFPTPWPTCSPAMPSPNIPSPRHRRCSTP